MKAQLLTAVLVLVGVDWPPLPFGARLADLVAAPLLYLAVLQLRKQDAVIHWLDGMVIAYFFSSAPSLVVTTDASDSGMQLLREGYLVGLYAATAAIVRGGSVGLVGSGLVAGGAALSVVSLTVAVLHALVANVEFPAIGEVMNLPYVGSVLRLKGLTKTPAMLGCLLTAAIPFALIRSVASRHRSSPIVWAGASVLMTAAVLMTFSHTISGFVVAAVFAAWPFFAHRRPWRVTAVAASVALVVVANLALITSIRSITVGATSVEDPSAYWHAVDRGEIQIGGARVQYELMSYFRLKQIAFSAFAARPWTGVGLDRFHEISEDAFRKGRLPAHYRSIDPHSTLLGRLAETGVTGGVALVALLTSAALLGHRSCRGGGPRSWAARGGVAALLGLILNGVNIDIMNFRFLWVLLGFLRGLTGERSSSRGVTGTKPVVESAPEANRSGMMGPSTVDARLRLLG